MTNFRLVAIGVTAVLAIVGCGPSSGSGAPTDPQGLTGRTFVSSDVTVKGEPSPLVKSTQLSLSFTDTGVSANAGCNTMGGSGSVRNGVLVTDGQLSMTQMGCEPDRMDQDQWYADLLASAPTVAVDGNTLTLTSQDTVIVMTDQAVAVPDQPLTRTTWTLDSITQGDTVSSVPAGVKSTLLFKDNGQVFVDAGCNSGTGSYEVQGAIITFHAIAITAMACASPKGGVEASVLTVLDGNVDYVINDSTLTLTNGANGLTYQ